jgi:hypothetical protein
LMNPNPHAMFAVYILEDVDGNIRVISDWSGTGERCLDLGVEIMQSLASVQPLTDGALSLAMPHRSDVEH